MPRIAYVNGQYVPHNQAAVHIEDRGYQFADGVYEAIDIEGGRLIDEAPHLDRLDRSLRELSMMAPMRREPLRHVMRELIRRNKIDSGFLYLQITRGVAPRDHAFPAGAKSALVMTVRRLSDEARSKGQAAGVAVVTVPDIRWQRCDIKSLSLLPNVLGKQAAREAGAFEAWMVDEKGNVTEGTSSNAWIVSKKGELITRNVNQSILSGVTRLAVLDIAKRHKLTFVERSFTVKEATQAREAFITSTTSRIKPVVSINGKRIGTGKPGTLTEALKRHYRDHVSRQSA